MFQRFGQMIARSWPAWVTLWVVSVVVAGLAAPSKPVEGPASAIGSALQALTAGFVGPDLEAVVQTGEFAFLPVESPSRRAEIAFAEAFPSAAQASTIAVVLRRQDGAALTAADLEFVDDGEDAAPTAEKPELKATLEAVARRLIPAEEVSGDDVERVKTFRDKTIGRFLLSPDERATLAVIDLDREFLDAANGPVVRAVEDLLAADSPFMKQVPPHLELLLSGTAVVGRDMLQEAKNSAKATEHLTIILVVILLVGIYRAPLLALVPLLTVFLSVKLSIALLCIMAQQGWIVLFTGFESYVTVLLYGAGVDYCLFLIARYKEEVDQGISNHQAVIDSVGYVGAAIAASAGTVICGIGMMVFAEFGKFRDAGIAISFGLVIVLIASLTFTPALLCLAGPAIFWPKQKVVHNAEEAPSASWLQNLWDHVGAAIVRRPMAIWLASLMLLAPLAIVGAYFYTDLSYGLLSDLPKHARSVVGTKAVREHFAAGTTGPILMLLRAPGIDFGATEGDDAGLPAVQRLTESLRQRRQELQLADIRSVSHPFGGEETLESITNIARRKITTNRAIERYVTQAEPLARSVTRIELTSEIDPFARESITQLSHLTEAVKASLPSEIASASEVLVLGPTASIRDLKHVTDRDQIRIDLLVIFGVFAILVVLLRQPGICLYLILSVLFSYLATLGTTYLSFWWWDGAEFSGLDWKVPMFLFTILIAVGEDYNIFLMTRIEEEQRRWGLVPGVIHALSKTGRIISSCGIIMAGTFASLAAGSLKGMSQLGFALAVGVLLDTFVVRPILVPAFLVLLHSGRFGSVGRWLASGGHSAMASTESDVPQPPPTAP